MGLLLIFFLLSIVFSFLCSVWEAVILSVTPAFVHTKQSEGGFVGKKLKEFKDEIDRPLSAILSLNTIAHTVGAIGVGAQAGKVFGANYFNLGPISLSYESLIAGGMTLAILILSEIIPKTLGANNWRSLTPFTVRSLNILLILLFPFVWVSQLITKALKNNKGESVLSRADFAAMAQVADTSGALDSQESTIIKNLLKFDSVTAKNVMTPRSLIVAADEDTTTKAFFDQHKKLVFSRIPVFEKDLDQLTGFVLKDDILSLVAEDKDDVKLSSLKREITAVNENRPLPDLLEDLIKSQKKLAAVVNEFGSVLGVVTLEDVLETLLGIEIVDESDSIVDLQEMARKKWEERAKKLGLVQ